MGAYRLHSEFESAVNYTGQDGRLVTLTTKQIGPGPQNIVLDALKGHGERLDFGAASFKTGSIYERYGKRLVYDSALPFNKACCANFKKNLPHLEKTLADMAPAKSLAFLLDNKRELEFRDGFEKQFMNRAFLAARTIFSGNAENGLAMISGTGFGLTPSGDDFTAGFLTGLNLFKLAKIKGADDLAARAMRVLRPGSPLVKNFIEMAAGGRVCEKFKQVLVSMYEDDLEGVKKTVAEYCGIGETSGADFLTGFIMTARAMGSGLHLSHLLMGQMKT